ncbi:MAG: hypothetical protein CVU05_13510 [Bacteroidetes bacterium HGW-Bacteroidetes-21]|jgi:hypothetical protein|nr:MAG: hypothetical protein CVU05_13510 [Bacteroidetes bacterium HGW-Bacteroidetes-21]
MKKLLIISLLLLSSTFSILACNIEFEVQGTSKETYKSGDEIVVKVKITLTHRVCNVAMKDTKFDTKGLDILGATDWKEVTPGVWERKVKLKAKTTSNGKLIFSVTRTCEKEGGSGSLTLNGQKA